MYPDYPNNRLIVDGVDLSETFKMVLVDGYTLSPPSPKTYTIDIPGGNGSIDLTEALVGDVTYKNREQTFNFVLIDTEDFEKAKTDISNFLHGKLFYYTMTMDPGYTYHGRFTVTSYTHAAYSSGILGTIVIKISADPYKYKQKQKFVIRNAAGGYMANVPSGRLTVRPKITVNGPCDVIYNGNTVSLVAGTYTISDLLLRQGINNIFFSTREVSYLSWGDIEDNGISWGAFQNRYIFEWYKSALSSDYEPILPTATDVVELEYDWGDL